MSIVVTVRNEAASIDELLAALAAQTVLPVEIIIVDGGSVDRTVPRLEDWARCLPLRVILAPGAAISTGRNLGIAAATTELVAVTDAGTRPAPGWLAAISARLLDGGTSDQQPSVISGWFVADPRTTFEEAMGATVLPALAEIDAATFLPSSRSLALRKSAWASAGGYPEWLDYGEDLVFDLALRAADQRFAFVPAALVSFRPRASLLAFWHQYFRYARGDGKAGLWWRRHLIRYGTYGSVLLLLLLGLRGGGRGLALALALLVPASLAYLWRPYARLLPRLGHLRPSQRLQAIALVPVIRLVGDLAKMAGYPVGLRWRAQRYGLDQDWRTIGRPPAPPADRQP